MLNYLLIAAAGAEGQDGIMGIISSMWPIGLMIVVFYFLLIRPQNKRDKQAKQMRESLEVGDEVITSGGIIGRVVSIRDDSLVIESGSDNNKMRIAKWAVQSNITPRPSPIPESDKKADKKTAE